VNTAPRRSRSVQESSFTRSARSHRLTYQFNDAANGKAAAILAWNKYIPLTPAMASKILTRGLPAQTYVNITDIDEKGCGEIEYHAAARRAGGHGGNAIFHDSREFDLSKNKLLDGLITVSGKQQEKNYGRIIFRNQIEFFHACGVKKFEVLAASTNGGYTWARFGFLPDTIRDNYFKTNVIEPIEEKYTMLRSLLPEAERLKIDQAIKFRKKTDMWKLADCEYDLVPVLSEVFNKANNKRYNRVLAQELKMELQDEFDRAKSAGRPLKLGRVLLTGTSWTAKLDFKNREQMKRVSEYTGGFKYIRIG
jgi:hypothetical protein